MLWPTLRKDERLALIALLEKEHESPEALALATWQLVNTLLRKRDGWFTYIKFGQTNMINGPYWREASAKKAAGEWAGAIASSKDKSNVIARIGALGSPERLDLKE